MNLIVYTDTTLSDLFEQAQFSDKDIIVSVHSIEKYIENIEEIEQNLRNNENNVYFYIDVSYLKQKHINKLLKKIEDGGLNIALIDPGGKIKDPIILMFRGIFDYLGKELIKRYIKSESIDIFRIEYAINFRKNQLLNANISKGVNEEDNLRKEFGFCKDWDDVVEGKEYLFWILFVAVQNVSKLKESMSNEYRKYLFTKFKEFIRKTVERSNGKIWIWNEHCGVVLFPYDGIGMDAIATSMRLIFNKRIFNFELGDSFNLSYKLALHKGKTVYRERGKTGTIISDDINKVFHIGLDFAKVPGLYITDAAAELLSEKAINAFKDLGSFEGSQIYKLYEFVK